jgi:hypothetical protein
VGKVKKSTSVGCDIKYRLFVGEQFLIRLKEKSQKDELKVGVGFGLKQ